MDKNYFRAIAVMVGYVIGVGMFGLPYLISKAGILTFLILLIFFGSIQYLLHLIYANLIIVTEKYHRLPGYVGEYLGHRGKIIIFIAKFIGNSGALLAYIIITGIFLNQLLSPYFGGNEMIYASLIFFLEAFIVFFGIRIIAKVELFMTILLLCVVTLISIKGWSSIEIVNYSLIDWKYFLLPYGAMLFAIDGGGSLPIVAKLLKRDKEKIKSVVKIGTFLSIFIIAVFTFIIIGITGVNTSPDALVGIKGVINNGVIFFALIFGVLTMTTSFLLVAESIKETLWWDFKLNKYLAWSIAVFVPYLLYVIGLKNLIEVISFVGGVAGSLCAIVLILVFLKLCKLKGKLVLIRWQPIKYFTYFFIFLFLAGMFYEIYHFLINKI